MNEEEDFIDLSEELERLDLVPTPDILTYELLLDNLTLKITDLINHNFPALVQLLYQLDISENRVRQLLQHNDDNSATVISEAIIERQLQKIKTKKAFKRDEDISEDERW